MKIRLAATFAALCLALSAQAADPTATVATPGISFAEYTSTVVPTGQGAVDTDTLYFIDELAGALGKSWFVFFDPTGGKDIFATVTFDAPITGVLTTKSDLDATNGAYGAPGINYGTSFAIGLEPMDAFSWVGNVLTINWHAVDPGDHIRVFTAITPVPEPETYALLMAGLLATGFIARRRSRL